VATTYPGIYTQETPIARGIQGASTSVAAFVGVTESGPIATPTLITSWNAYVRQFGNLVWYGYVSWAVFEFFNEGGIACYVVRASDTADASPARATSAAVTFTAATPGTWGNSLQVAFINGSAQTGAEGVTPAFNFLVVVDAALIETPRDPASPTDPSGAILQSYALQNGLPRQTISGKAYCVLEAFNGFTAASMAPNEAFMQRVNTSSMFVRVASSGTTRPANAVAQLADGRQTSYDLVGAVGTLDKVQGLSLLAVPDTVTATDASGNRSPKQQAALINQSLAICEKLQSLFYVSDPPFGLDVEEMLSFKIGNGTSADANTTALNSSYGAIYYPWVSMFNPTANTSVPMPPSGPVLGRYAYTDTNVGVWKAPAGVNDGAMRSVTTVATQVTDDDQGTLNPAGINAIRNLISYGNVVYGARTLSQGTEWTYIAVRRLLIYVEQSLKQSLQWVVFEEDSPRLWASVNLEITAFLTTLWQQGALFGSTAAEAFFVTCDASNNPPDARAQGQLYIDVGLAPVYPAEFVILRITQQTAGPDSGA
jgi:phage tail sheath protein FI